MWPSRPGDVNGDGLDDLLAGQSNHEAYLYLGPVSTSLDGSGWSTRFVDGAASIVAGSPVAGKGDINGDGYPDVAVGDTGSFTGPGSVSLFLSPVFGEHSIDDADATLLGTECWVCCDGFGKYIYSDADFGHAIELADVNNDGFADAIVGAPGTGVEGAGGECVTTAGGVVYIFFGPLSGTLSATEADVAIGALGLGDSLGSAVAAAGDVNADGFTDLIVGGANVGTEGAAYLLYGPIDGPVDLARSRSAPTDLFNAPIPRPQGLQARSI